MLFPQGIPSGVGQVVKADPHIAAGGTGEVFPPYLLVFLREVEAVAVGVECLRIGPLNLGSLWIDLEPNSLAQGIQVLHCDLDGWHVLRGLRQVLLVCHCVFPSLLRKSLGNYCRNSPFWSLYQDHHCAPECLCSRSYFFAKRISCDRSAAEGP